MTTELYEKEILAIVDEAMHLVDAGRDIARRWPPPPEKYGTAISVRELIRGAYSYRYTANPNVDELHCANLTRKLIDLATIRRNSTIDLSVDDDIQEVANLVREELLREQTPLRKLAKELRLAQQWPELPQAIMDLIADLDPADPAHGLRSVPESFQLQAVACFRMLLGALIRKRIERDRAWLDEVEPQPPAPPRRPPAPERKASARRKQDRDLLWACDEADNLVFAPRAVVRDLRIAREQIPKCRTWRDAKKLLPVKYFEEFVDRCVAPVNQPPRDEDAIAPEDLRIEEWPLLRYHEMEDWLPAVLFSRFSKDFEGLMESGTLLPAYDDECESQDDKIVAWLERRGFTCELDRRLPELFDTFAQ